jgi:nitroreductase
LEFKELVLNRRSIRRFLADSVSEEDIKDIISIATHACNSGNKQFWRFIIIRSETVKKEIAKIGRDKAAQLLAEANHANPSEKKSYKPQEFHLEAPVIIGVVATQKYRTQPDLLMLEAGYSETVVDDLRCRGDMQTIGAVIQLILLSAWEKGLGSCWMTGPLFARKELEELLGIAARESLAALIPIGKPAVMPANRERKPIEEVMSFL